MSKKTDRAKHGPGWGEVILGATLSLFLGAFLGAVVLMVRPVTAVRELPKEDALVKNAVYYIEGTRDSSKGRSAPTKRAQFVAGQPVEVVEDEVNALVQAKPAAKAPAAAKEGEKKDAPADDAGMIAAGTPNVRIRDGRVQVGAPVTFNVMGLTFDTIVHGKGGFKKDGNVFVYAPDELYVGSCRVERIPFLAGFIRDKVFHSQPIPEDIATAWQKVTGVSVEGNTVKVAM